MVTTTGVVALDGSQLVCLRLVSSLKNLSMIIRFFNITLSINITFFFT
uniref:Uncharacterized protein n=1 Tax=Lepeophtheirus salmonis TaxID=72036 RepID=A0A0K2SVC0_LEPSM